MPAGFPQPEAGGAFWWLLRPLWLLLLTGFLVPFVWAFGRFERAALTRPTARRIAGSTSIAGVCLLVIGLAGFATAGFAHLTDAPERGLPLIALSPLASGAVLLAAAMLMRSRRDSRI